MPETYFPVLLAMGFAALLGVVLLSVSWIAGRKRGGRTDLSPVESGMPLLDDSRKRVSIVFFLIAIDFIVFDLEAAFLYPWALVFRWGGWELFAAVLVFVALILIGYAYVWKKGGLDFGGRRGAELDRGAAR
ncbi:MAG TPA: NADH-quinone oxidoreductase subunit A [Thermoanaerobaculia bacterium]|nr:NADH-quinone oxidoreductase subunit A [Thermoanaerobaculia bacterium]